MLLGPRDGALWVVNATAQPVALQLGHVGYRCCSLIASHDYLGGRQAGVLRGMHEVYLVKVLYYKL